MKFAKFLLEAGVQKDLQDMSGNTALILAAAHGHLEIARLLLEAGANRDLQNSQGLSCAAYLMNRGEMESLLSDPP